MRSQSASTKLDVMCNENSPHGGGPKSRVTSLDVTGLEGVEAGEEITLIGEGLDASKMAETCGSIPYEVLCGISNRVPRVYV
jgi:alanine racemase